MKVKKVGVLGAGLMGRGIAMSCLNNGLPVVLVEAQQKFLDNGIKEIAKTYASSVKKGKMKQENLDKLMRSITPSLDYASFKGCDMVIEAVFEDMTLKKEIFAKLDNACDPHTILCTNTSFLDVDQIASATKRPHKVIGTHFFSPAHIMRLLENVRGKLTDRDTIATCMAFGKRIGKVPTLVGNCDGFVGNRMITR